MSMKKGCVLALVCLLLISTFASGLIQKFHVKDDHRRKFFLDNFGFEAGGSINLQIKNFQLNPPVASARVGFIIEKTQTDATRFLEDSSDHGECELGGETDLLITNFTETNLKYTIRDNEEGFYNIYFVKCVASKHSFEIVVDLHNEGENGPIYLSAGMAPLTTVYSLLFIVYASIILAWTFGFMRGADKRVYLIHYLMTLLIILKSLSVLFKAIELHYLKLVGHAGTWAAIYYIFSFLKGIMMFVVVALVGTGWTFIKPFLAEKDKKVFLVVIPLQILDNIAMVVIEETAPGSQGWFTWKDIFRLVDIICCGAVLIPIIWSIKYLKEASQIDGKAARNMQKLKLFRQFYLIVVSYIYFTRIIVYLLDATLPFRWVWLGDLFTEAATLAFFCTTGYQFRPISNNPFLSLEDEDADQDDEDLEDGSSVASSSSNSLPASSSGSVNSSN